MAYTEKSTRIQDALRVSRWADLPEATKLQFYEISADGETKIIGVSKHCRQVLEGLRNAPIYCASIARISNYVNVLRHDFGVDIETLWFKSESGRFGVYVLRSDVREASK